MPFSIKGIRKGYLFRQNGTEKVNVLNLGAEPSYTELYSVPLPGEQTQKDSGTVAEGVNALVECVPKRH